MQLYVINDVVKDRRAPGLTYRIVGVNEEQQSYICQQIWTGGSGVASSMGQRRLVAFNIIDTEFESILGGKRKLKYE